MSENKLTIGGKVKKSNVVSGNGNTIIQIINKIYKSDDLNKLVNRSFPDPASLRVFWKETFPAVTLGAGQYGKDTQPQSSYELLINDFKQSNEMVRLLGEIKKRNPTEYRSFLASQVLEAIGLSGKDIPAVKTSKKAAEKEILTLQNIMVPSPQKTPSDILDFEDRKELQDQLLHDTKYSHVVLHGTSGVGKTHFLRYFQEKSGEDTRCVFIDLKSCKKEKILAKVIELLGGAKRQNSGYLELATLMNTLFRGEPSVNRFYFLFDNADQNQAAVDYLFGPDNIVDNPTLMRILEDWKLLDNIQLKIMLAARHPVKPSTIHPAFSNKRQEKMEPLAKVYIYTLLDKLIKNKHIQVPLKLKQDLSDEVYYLTGGHPKCAKQMLVALIEKGCIRPTKEEWQQLYREHVIATIYTEMLKPINPEIMSTIWYLGIFRRFDQRLLGGLLDRGLLPSLPGDKSRQARELRSRLEEINLFDKDETTATITTNYAMRHAILLNMQSDAPDRYKMLNMIALEMFLDRLHGETGQDKQIERMAANLFEILYHWTKLIEIESQTESPSPDARSICTRVCEAFENYLLFALTMVREEAHPAFLQFLTKRWTEDTELQETIRRVARREDCVQALQQVLNKHHIIQDSVD